MKVITNKLFDDRKAILKGYLYDNSLEFQMDKKRPAVIICPGEGYWYVSEREADAVAFQYLAEGYQTFVLYYTTGAEAVYPVSLQELSKAVSLIRTHADEWYIDSNRIFGCGFSAGGHLLASLGVHADEEMLTGDIGVREGSNHLNALVLGYPAISLKAKEIVVPPEIQALIDTGEIGFGPGPQYTLSGHEPTDEELIRYDVTQYVTEKTPPVFLWHTYEDSIIPFEDGISFIKKLHEHGVNAELHIFSTGNHGLSLATELTAKSSEDINDEVAVWFQLSIKWLKKQMSKSDICQNQIKG